MIKTGKELAAACVDVAKNHKTLYVMGAFGWPMNDHNKQRAMGSYSYNSAADRTAKIKAATKDTFGFDCVCLIKALLWGWQGDAKQNYGGAKYCSNNVPDVNEDGMIRVCTEVSADFGKIAVGEVLWTSGHIGVYIGEGLAVECTPVWEDGVQITAVHNIGKKSGYNCRVWTKHGKLPWVTYEAAEKLENEEKKAVDYTLAFRYLRKGDKGDDVVAAQRLLIANGYSCGWYGADGDFGVATDTAVRLYQRNTGLEVDGIVGKDTLGKLLGV